ncbi:MAG: UbiH/UbiF/VisC/COQ6 family ubiquinone biosynthesis hydroxylase [Gammaproteobacteria bacterium]
MTSADSVPSSDIDFDVTIAGGGMVGSALACALAREGFQVALVEGRVPGELPEGSPADLRVSAISPASRRLFTRLGAWDGMVARRVTPYEAMEVWDEGGAGSIRFDSAELGEPTLGHIVENRVVQLALLDRARALDGVRLFTPGRVAGFENGADHSLVRLDDGGVHRTRVLVAADGRDSKLRAWAGIGTRGWDYDQHAVVATVACERGHGNTAWQRFLPDGPLAFLPLWDGRCSIVWSTAPDHADELLAMDPDKFRLELGRAFDFRLGEVSDIGPRAAFPLRYLHAERYVAGRTVLVGDAAHGVHPLAGQGVNLGLLDVAALAEVMSRARKRGVDIGDPRVLARYGRWRRGHNMAMGLAFDGFKRLFGSRLVPLRVARNIGLGLAGRFASARQRFMRTAMGLDPDLPPLARP